MSLRAKNQQLGEDDFREWLSSLGLLSSSEDKPFRDQIRDGVLLCQLVNKIRPGSVDTVSSIRQPRHGLRSRACVVGCRFMFAYIACEHFHKFS